MAKPMLNEGNNVVVTEVEGIIMLVECEQEREISRELSRQIDEACLVCPVHKAVKRWNEYPETEAYY